MNLTRKDLKIISYEFNSVSSRLLKAHFHDYINVLKKFIARVDNTILISDYIKDCGNPTYDIAEEVSAVASSYGRRIFVLGDIETEEVANIYHILKYIIENHASIHNNIAMGYLQGSDKYQDAIKGFNERVVLVLIRHIEDFLTEVGIDMGVDDSVSYNITVNNGQVNLATDNATITATQNQGIDIAALISTMERIIELSTQLPSEKQVDISDCVEALKNEISLEKPRKSLLKNAISTLSTLSLGITSATELVTNIEKLTQMVSQFLL